jgi:uncharacterized membrane protein
MTFFKLYLVSLVVFFAIDLLWLGVIAKNLYREQIGSLMADEIRWGAAILFYAIYIAGLVFFAQMPALNEGSLTLALVYGALFGFFCYATYDLTNLATLKGWPVKIVVYDLLWGTFISGATSLITVWIVDKFIGNK